MNSIVNRGRAVVSTIVIVAVLLCLALFVGVLLIHSSMNEAHLVKHGIMIVQAHRMVVGILPPCCLV
jgi:hypothetical protein